MFQVGDKIVYPMHGAGVIEALEEKEVLGTKHDYYIINISVLNLRVMVPVKKASELGIRYVVDPVELDGILNTNIQEESDLSLNWNQRYRIYMDKIKTGNIHDAAEVIRDLLTRSKVKALNAAEKSVLNQAKQIFISEMVLVREITENHASNLVDQMCGC